MNPATLPLEFYSAPAPSRPAQASAGRATGGRGFADIRARYESAENTTENQPLWTLVDYLSAKAANSYFVRRQLKLRARYEGANNSYFRGIIDTIANDLIGTGPRLRCRHKDPEVNRSIEQPWGAWCKAVGFAEKLRTMAKSKIVDGEAFALLVNNQNLRRTFGGPLDVDDAVQLDLSVIESDQVTTPDPGFIAEFWVDGLVLDNLGNPTEYHVLRHHPGDLFIPQLNPLVYDRWKPMHVVHWLRKDRPGQVRGVPEITPALELFAQLRRYTKAVLAAAETAADFAAVLETEAPANDDPSDPANSAGAQPFDQTQIDRGLMTALPYGSKLNQLKAEQPATTYEMFVRVLLREICRCLGIPLNIAMGDSSGYNYSSGRLDHLGYHRQQRIDRHLCDSIVLGKVFAAWYEEAIMVRGLLHNAPPTPPAHSWHWDEAESIDPVKDATADEVQLATNLTTLEERYAAKGQEWEPAIRQRAREIALCRELGVPVPEPKTKAGEATSPEEVPSNAA